MDKRQISQAVESYIDSHGLSDLLNVIGTVCCDKAEHVIVNWQDMETADQWDRAANAVFAARRKALDSNL